MEPQNFTAWNAGLRQTVEQTTALSSSDLAIDFGHQHRPIRRAADIGLEAIVLGKIGPFDHFAARARKLVIVEVRNTASMLNCVALPRCETTCQ